DKYFRYHRDHRHYTEECRHLKNQIEDLVRKGHLQKYVDRNAPYESRELREEDPQQPEEQQLRGVIHTIFGGVASDGDHSRGRKAYTRQIFSVQQYEQSKRIKTGGDEEVISLSEVDYEGVHLPHDYPVVVTLQVALFTMKRILVDSGSLADILNGPMSNTSADDLVVDTPSPYNTIIGRPGLNLMEAIVSTRHLVMKFPTRFGVEEVRGDQQVASQCYKTAIMEKGEE
ncbi:LOW QUALITY PROTEIN: hypothetical protein CFOL_v3_19020, partial [Cephalotus follicularis]